MELDSLARFSKFLDASIVGDGEDRNKELPDDEIMPLKFRESDSPALKIQRVLDDSNVGDGVDRISKLPDGIISHIFSFLPPKKVGRTSTLSRGWRYKWTLHPNLEFSNTFIFDHREHARRLARFKNSVDHAIFCHGASSIKKCSFHCRTLQVFPYLFGWVSAVLTCNVQELYIKSGFHVQELPPSLFTCKTLVTLEIEGNFLLNLPYGVRFPRLKTFSLQSVIYGDDLSMQRLFSSCPLLEDLKIQRQGWDGVLNASIPVPSLKRLFISQSYLERIEGYQHKMVIDAPKLEYFQLEDDTTEVFDVSFSDSLVEVDILGVCGPGILEEISHVRKLALSGRAFWQLRNTVLPVFSNLVHLELGFGGGWHFLSNLLSNTPNLKVIVFAKGLIIPSEFRHVSDNIYWDLPEPPPICLVHHLKEIKIHNFVGKPYVTFERFFIRYLLEHGKVLDKVTIYWYNDFGKWSKNREEISSSYQRIMDYNRGSPTCEVEFITPDGKS